MSERKPKKTFSLRNLKIEEISGVDRGANPGAHILFFKRNQKEPNNMDLETLSKKFDALEKSSKEQTDEITKLKADKETLKALAEMSDAEKAFHKGLAADKQEAFLKADAATRKKQMDDAEAALKKKKADDENSSDVQKAVAPVQKELDETKAALKKLQEKDDLREFEKSFDKDLPNFGGTADEKQELMKSLQAMPEAARKTLMDSLKKADEVKGKYFTEVGKAGKGPDSAEGKLEGLAKKRAEEKGESYEVAYSKVLETKEGQDLYAQAGKQ